MQLVNYNYKEYLFKLIMLFPIATLFQNYIGFFNKGLFALTMALLIFKVMGENKCKIKNFIYISIVTSYCLFVILITPIEAIKVNYNMSFYYLFMIYYIVLIISDKDDVWRILKKNHNFIYANVLIYTAVVTISIFIPNCYIIMGSGGWGESRYFASISGSPNRVGPASLFILILIIYLIVIGYSKKILLLALPQLYVFLMGGSRTYFVLGTIVFLLLIYVIVDNKKLFLLCLIPVIAIGIIVVSNSAMMNKFEVTIQENVSDIVFLQKITNTRSIFWVEQIKLFNETSLLKRIFGNGINFTSYNYGLWAHNDFIEILCSYGYVGLMNYIIIMFRCFSELFSVKGNCKILKISVILVWLFNACVNFYYCYFCAMLSYPILLLVIEHYVKNRDSYDMKEELKINFKESI